MSWNKSCLANATSGEVPGLLAFPPPTTATMPRLLRRFRRPLCDPSGILAANDRDRGCRFAQPPAIGCHPSGMMGSPTQSNLDGVPTGFGFSSDANFLARLRGKACGSFQAVKLHCIHAVCAAKVEAWLRRKLPPVCNAGCGQGQKILNTVRSRASSPEILLVALRSPPTHEQRLLRSDVEADRSLTVIKEHPRCHVRRRVEHCVRPFGQPFTNFNVSSFWLALEDLLQHNPIGCSP